MALLEINWSPSSRVLRQFGGVVLPVACALGGVLAWYATGSWRITVLLWVAGAVVIPFGWLRPGLFRPVYSVWMHVAYPIGWVISHLLMAVTYYVVLTPIGLLTRLCGRDAMTKAADPSAETYWVKYNWRRSRDRYFRQS
jgi:hypothetical protein